MKKLLLLLSGMVVTLGTVATTISWQSTTKANENKEMKKINNIKQEIPERQNISTIEMKLQSIIDSKKDSLWTAEGLSMIINIQMPQAAGIVVTEVQSDQTIGAAIFNFDATNTRGFFGNIKLTQILNRETQNKTIYINVKTNKIAMVDDYAPYGTIQVLNLGWDATGKARRMTPKVEIVPNYISPKITSINMLFNKLENFNCQEITYWDTSNITDMSSLFTAVVNFNQDISGWNTSNVTDMSKMFIGAYYFNQDISKWDTSKVTNMKQMFDYAATFNQDISKWDTSKVTDMSGMFVNANSFNQNISGWDTSNVMDMGGMFYLASHFNQNISKWDTSKVTNMDYMFYAATIFNQDISKWDTSKVTNMSRMFWDAKAFNQDLSKWDVDLVKDYKDFANNPNWDVNKQPKFKQS
ncbi:BspA family leucine-rich repeat surface protein [Williamsoniiplasma luminosum]|nr:BspA family leucine-rich repeat surface protein [Williamsoniiplasma luminosum]